MDTENRKPSLTIIENSLIPPLVELGSIMTKLEDTFQGKIPLNNSFVFFSSRKIEDLLEKSTKQLAEEYFDKSPSDKWRLLFNFNYYIEDAIKRLKALSEHDERFSRATNVAMAMKANFKSFEEILLTERIAAPKSQKTVSPLEFLEDFFLGSGLDEFVEQFYLEETYPDIFIKKIQDKKISLKYDDLFLSSVVSTEQLNKLRAKSEKNLMGYSYILGNLEEIKEGFELNLEDELLGYSERVLESIIADYIRNTEEASKVETLFKKLVSTLQQISHALSNTKADPLKVSTFIKLVSSFKEQVKNRYSEFYKEQLFVDVSPLTTREIKLTMPIAEKICKIMSELQIFKDDLKPINFIKIIDQDYKGKDRISWLAQAKSKSPNYRLLLTFLKFLDEKGLIPEGVLLDVKSVNEYIGKRFVKLKDESIEIGKSSFSSWGTDMEASETLQQFCDKDSNPKKQKMFRALDKIFQDLAMAV